MYMRIKSLTENLKSTNTDERLEASATDWFCFSLREFPFSSTDFFIIVTFLSGLSMYNLCSDI